LPKWKGWESKVQPSINEIIPEIRIKLGNQKEKLEDVAERLYQRDKEILQRCVGAQLCGDNDRSKIYANECAEIRRMYTTVKATQISLEKVIIRFDSISLFEDALVQINPVMEIVRSMRGDIEGLAPEVAKELEGINSVLEDIHSGTGQASPINLELVLAGEEAKRVLEESKLVASQKASERFPEIPIESRGLTQTDLTEILKDSEDILNTNSNEAFVQKSESLIVEEVLSYIKSKEGRLSVRDCAYSLSINENDVRSAIDVLKDQGRLVIEREAE
jgi:division protein CdvB (Snf7/Vps24/ESCRT-III family)